MFVSIDARREGMAYITCWGSSPAKIGVPSVALSSFKPMKPTDLDLMVKLPVGMLTGVPENVTKEGNSNATHTS